MLRVKPTLNHEPVVTDLAEHRPSTFNPLVENVENGTFYSSGPWVRHYYESEDSEFKKVCKHTIVGVSVGQDDNVEVNVRWHHPTWYSYFGQVGPIGWIDPEGDDRELGFGAFNDISIFGGAGYAIAGFDAPRDQLMYPRYYPTTVAKDLPPALKDCIKSHKKHWPMGENGPYTDMKLVASKKTMSLQFGSKWPITYLPVPDWADGRDCWGVHIIEIQPDIGEPHWTWGEAISGVEGEKQGWYGEPVEKLEPAIQVEVSVEVRN